MFGFGESKRQEARDRAADLRQLAASKAEDAQRHRAQRDHHRQSASSPTRWNWDVAGHQKVARRHDANARIAASNAKTLNRWADDAEKRGRRWF